MTPTKKTRFDFVHSIPKAELHVHLEGTIQPETALILAARHGQEALLPAQDVEGLRRWFVFQDFPHFVEVYLVIQSLIASADDVSTVVYRCGADMQAQNIRYREATVTTYTHTHLQKKSLAIEAILEGLDDGRRRARRDFGVEMRWIFDVPRNAAFKEGRYCAEPAEVTLAHALAGRDQGVVGLGLGGYEVGAPPEPFAHAFHVARAEGLLSVPHAGETEGPGSIWGAVNELQADRIGHGVRAIEDPVLLQHLAERQIPLEVNPFSNLQLGIYPSADQHPFAHLDRMGLLLTINSDDPPLFNTTLLDEYQLLAETFGYGKADLKRFARNALRVSAAEPALKQVLLAEFDAWASGAGRPGEDRGPDSQTPCIC